MSIRQVLKMSRKATAMVGAVVLLGSLVACSESASESDEVYSVYVSMDMSGPAKSYSEAMFGGLNLAAERINADGGIDGKTVVIELADDQSDPSRAVSLLQRRLAKDTKPDLVFAGSSSSVSLAMLPVLTRNEVLSMSGTTAAAINDPASYPYHFGAVLPGPAYITAIANKLEESGVKKVAMLHPNDASGEFALGLVTNALTERGISLESTGFAPDSLDMSAQLEQLRSSDPDALIIDGYGAPTLYAFRSRAKIGWDVETYASQNASLFPLVDDLTPSELEGVNVTTVALTYEGWKRTDAMEEFVETVKASEYKGLLNSAGMIMFVVGHDVLAVASHAAENATSNDIDDIVAAMSSLPVSSDETPWLLSGTDGGGIEYVFNDKTHFPTAGKNLVLIVPPGVFNESGLYASK